MGYRTKCVKCGKHKRIVGKGVCVDCMSEDLQQNIKEMREKKGPKYKKWRKNLEKGLSKPKKQRISPADESKILKHNLVRVHPKSITFKVCPGCMAYNKATAKRCKICGIHFA